MIIFCASYLYHFCVCDYLLEISTCFSLSFLFQNPGKNGDCCLKIIKVHQNIQLLVSSQGIRIDIVQASGSHKQLPCKLDWVLVHQTLPSS